MPKIKYKKVLEGSGSNETQQETVLVDELVGPFIDKISVTVPVDDNVQSDALKEILTAQDALNPKKNPEGKAGVEGAQNDLGMRWGPKGNYRHGFWIHGKNPDGTLSKEAMLFQAVPKKGSNAFYRLEWNPRLFGPENLEDAKLALTAFMHNGWEYVVKRGRITRLDVAIDLTKVHVDTLVLRGKRPQKFGLYTGRDGRLETIYVGDPRGSHIIAYDRMKRIKANGGNEPLPLIGPVTRIETVKKNISVPLLDILDQADPFEGVQVFQFPGDEHIPTLTRPWPMFRDMCQVRGFHRAMKAVSPILRKNVRKHLPELRPHWWEQEKIWKRWADEVEAQRLLIPYGK